jgi:stage II sporulation protein D
MGSLKLMRRFFPLVALLAALAFAATASGKTLFVIKGKGWGHGVGLSQYGAYGLARGYGDADPHTYQQILAHYFPGTTLQNRRGASVKVLLAGGRRTVTVRSGAPFTIRDGDRSKTHPPGAAEVTKTSTGRIKVEGIRGTFDPRAIFGPTTRHLKLGTAPYRGDFIISISNGRLRVVNRLGIDAYVRGVVTLESPAAWGDHGAQAALDAQAVVARSYALYKKAHGGGNCGGVLCATTSDQVYGGVNAETANGVEAVKATAGKVVVYNGEIAQTFYSSSSGGRTAASVDTWGGNLPYLTSVQDPADLNAANPNRTWVVERTPRKLQSQLSLNRVPANAFVSERASGRAREITAKKGGWTQRVRESPITSAFGSEYFRAALGIRSGRIWIGVQAIRADKREVACKEAVRLNVFARDVGSVSVQQRKATGSTWTNIRLNKIDATHWRTTRHPCVSVDYRVKSDLATGPKIHVRVSPDVAFDASQRSDVLSGKVNPLLAGIPVAVERRTDSGWTLAAVTALLADGSFRAPLDVEEGVYRARVVPPAWTGMVPAYSPTLTVVTN